MRSPCFQSIPNPSWIKRLASSATAATSPRKHLSIQIIEHHLPRFLSHVAEHGTQLPRFITQEFDDYLACGRLEHGFLRVKCDDCRHEHLVAEFRGEVDKAFEFLNNAAENNSSALAIILSETVLYSLHSDPRWQPLLEKVNLLEYWLEMSPEWGGPQ